MTTMTKTHIDKLRNSDYLGGWDLIVDSRGVQHIYELSPSEFYNQLMKLD